MEIYTKTDNTGCFWGRTFPVEPADAPQPPWVWFIGAAAQGQETARLRVGWGPRAGKGRGRGMPDERQKLGSLSNSEKGDRFGNSNVTLLELCYPRWEPPARWSRGALCAL